MSQPPSPDVRTPGVQRLPVFLRRYGKTTRGSDLPDELRRRQDRLERIRQARKEMEAETAAAAARQRQEEADQARAEADAARKREHQRVSRRN